MSEFEAAAVVGIRRCYDWELNFFERLGAYGKSRPRLWSRSLQGIALVLDVAKLGKRLSIRIFANVGRVVAPCSVETVVSGR